MQNVSSALQRLGVFVCGMAVALLVAAPVHAQVPLTASQQAELTTIKVELVQILVRLQEALALGSNSSVAQAIFNSLSTQLLQLQQRLFAVLSSVGSLPGSAGSACPSMVRDLDPGMTGQDVASLQTYLTRDPYAQYAGPVTSVFDAYTVQGVQRLQAALGILSSGSPVTTGWGRVGPKTRAVIAQRCRTIVLPPVQPPTQPTVPQQPTTPKPDDSTATIKLMDVNPNLPKEAIVQVIVKHGVNCAPAQYTLYWGDGMTETVSFGAACGTQTRLIPHQYQTNAQFAISIENTTTLSKASISVAIPRRTSGGGTASMTVKPGDVSFEADVTVTYDPKGNCRTSSYTLEYGDNATANVSFTDSCSVQTQTLSHVYSTGGVYTLKLKDNIDTITTATITAVPVQSAGAGDPYIVYQLKGEASPLVDSSRYARTVQTTGSPLSSTARAVVGSHSILLDGNDAVSTPAHADLNFDGNAFTLATWFYADALPQANTQTALVIQANAEAIDSSLGGAGLVLFGKKLAYVGRIGTSNYHPYYLNTILSAELETGRWYHAAVTRSGNTVYLFLDGKKQGQLTVSGAANASAASLTVGRYGEYNGNYFSGSIDELEISKGIARWTADFDPPTYYGFTDTRAVSVTTERQGDRTVKINLTRAGSSVCTASTYTIEFGDTTNTAVSFGATCASETKSVTHTYGSTGTYTGSVKKGTTPLASFSFVATTPTGSYSQASYYSQSSYHQDSP